MTQPQPPRPGKVLLGLDPATVDGPTLAFIGRIGSPWAKGNSPKVRACWAYRWGMPSWSSIGWTPPAAI